MTQWALFSEHVKKKKKPTDKRIDILLFWMEVQNFWKFWPDQGAKGLDVIAWTE